ncbi:MAG TPA: FAD-dependent monooxygenase, partial [Streptosporangiaceae bacterium]
PYGAQAIAACLPPPLFGLFAATCGEPGTGVTVLSERLRVLHHQSAGATGATGAAGASGPARFALATFSAPASRRTLREVLAHGLAGRIRFGAELTGFEAGADGVLLRFAGGGSAEADVLVGADGAGSVVRRALLPHAVLADTGTRCVYGRSPLRAELLAGLPAEARSGFTAVLGRRAGLALAPLRFRTEPGAAAREAGLDGALSPEDDYLMWAVTARGQDWPVAEDQWDGLSPGELHSVARGMTGGFDPALREIVGAGDPGECFLIRIRSAEPVPAWEPGRVTLLGDAIHAMSPARGSGANTALRDAALLAAELAGAARGEKPLATAIGDYESAMRDYGFAAVAESARAEADTVRRRHGLGAMLAARLPRGRSGQ